MRPGIWKAGGYARLVPVAKLVLGKRRILSTLPASGQLTEMELQELLEHSRQCSSCGSRLVEMAVCSRTILSGHAYRRSRSPLLASMSAFPPAPKIRRSHFDFLRV